jgi:hypothetical protein
VKEILHEQVKRTERELARLRRELKEVTSAPAQSSTDYASWRTWKLSSATT